MDRRFEQVDRRIEQVDRRIEQVEHRFGWLVGIVLAGFVAVMGGLLGVASR